MSLCSSQICQLNIIWQYGLRCCFRGRVFTSYVQDSNSNPSSGSNSHKIITHYRVTEPLAHPWCHVSQEKVPLSYLELPGQFEQSCELGPWTNKLFIRHNHRLSSFIWNCFHELSACFFLWEYLLICKDFWAQQLSSRTLGNSPYCGQQLLLQLGFLQGSKYHLPFIVSKTKQAKFAWEWDLHYLPSSSFTWLRRWEPSMCPWAGTAFTWSSCMHQPTTTKAATDPGNLPDWSVWKILDISG